MNSMLNLLNSKWGSSSIAIGEPLLFPYNTAANTASYRWTLNDNDISAGDVYSAMGNPTVFHLRYGWFSNSESETSGVPSTLTFSEECLESENMQKDCNTKVENTNDEEKQLEVTRGELKAIIESGETNEGSSILDAEDAYQAFTFQKLWSSEEDTLAYSKSFSQGIGTETLKFPNLTEANIQSGIPQGHAKQESEEELLFSSPVYNDESSLGLSGIKWTDFLGPFDLGLSSSRKILSRDNISMSRIVN